MQQHHVVEEEEQHHVAFLLRGAAHYRKPLSNLGWKEK